MIPSQNDGAPPVTTTLKQPTANIVAVPTNNHRNNSSKVLLSDGDAEDPNWTNKTLARLAELSQLENAKDNGRDAQHSNGGNPSSPDDSATADNNKGESFLSRITSWFHAKSDSSSSIVPLLDSRSQDQIIKELKASILAHAKRQKKEDERIQVRQEALQLAVQELTEMETEIKATENVLSKAKADVTIQKEQMDELVEEKKVRDATEELEKTAEALEEGKMLRVDYETGRVTNLVDDMVDALESSKKSPDSNDGDEAEAKQYQAGNSEAGMAGPARAGEGAPGGQD